MILVLHGENDYAIAQAVAGLKASVGPPEARDANIHSFGPQATLAEVRAVCEAMPFLAERRLVLVEGLLSQYNPRQESRVLGPRQGRETPDAVPQIAGGWEAIEALSTAIPPTTTLAFVDGPLQERNPLLRRLARLAEVRHFPSPRDEEKARWLKSEVTKRGGQIAPGALNLLAKSGLDLWSLSNEVEKLCLYALGRPIVEQDVRILVPESRDVNVFAAVDALLEERTTQAARLLLQLRADGASLSNILSMISRQLRQRVLAKELLENGVAEEELGTRLGIRQEWAVRRTVEQARRCSWERLQLFYQRLLAADLSVKRGKADEETALEILIGELTGQRARATQS